MNNDIELCIAIGWSASSKVWKNTNTTWSELVDKLSRPVITPETQKQFLAAPKAEQMKIKDVGGFVGGFLTGGKRDKKSVLYRQVLTLDIDFSTANFWDDFLLQFDCAACIHSTHKSTPSNPRHRLIIPVDREVSQEEYQAISRKVAGILGIDLFDQSTFDVNRLMFWPSVSNDAEYYYRRQDGPILSADYILGLYHDWHDVSEWPTTTAQTDSIQKALKLQEDPTTKKGIVGVFCRAYSITAAIETFLSDVYVPAMDGRYTFAAGSTAAGVLTYDDLFAYSHHGTDPAGGRLCNAFDLVRIHRFGHLDTGKEKSELDKKSFRAMEEYAAQDPLIKHQIANERFSEVKADFLGKVDTTQFQENDDWVEELEVNTHGEYISSANNINIILRNDPLLKGAFKLNTFNNKRYVMHELPWRSVPAPEPLRDVDYSGVRNYIECLYGIAANQKIEDSLALEFERNSFHPIIEYLEGLTWDGVSRIDNLLIEYFGAKDNDYSKMAIRKMLCAAVARVFVPGIKYDLVLVLVGPQETYKSTFVKKLGGEWFSDTFTTVQGKESFEQLQGAWIIEIAELSGLKKAEIEAVKHFITKREDSFRPAYGRVVETYKRQCVFFGTTNNADFLRDPTGNRRFMPIDVNIDNIKKSVMNDLDQYEIDQIWAEAFVLYKAGEPLYLTGDADSQAKTEQMRHSEADDRSGIVEDYMHRLLPAKWDKMGLYERRAWLEDPLSDKGVKQRDFICAAEVWCECLGKDKSDMTKRNSREINEIIRSLPEWEPVITPKRFAIYGLQRYYRRKDSLL